MKTYIKSFFLVFLLTLVSCESLVDDLNDNPNEITPGDINPELFLTGAMLSNTLVQAGHLNRISGMWSGQLTGFTSLYSNIYGFAISTAESESTWSRLYVGNIANARYIRDVAAGDGLLVGIAKMLEAHSISTGASLFGDIPYSQAVDPTVEDPVFDGQSSVFISVLALIDSAIADLNAGGSRGMDEDIYFGGDATAWIAAANTLKARIHLQMKDYGSAYTAAQSGISSAGGDLNYTPRGDASVPEGDKNLFWEILEGSRAGDIGTGDSYLIQLLDASSGVYRGNAKTDETARLGYSRIDESSGSVNQGIIEQFEPHRLVTYAENQLILAECAARTQSLDAGLAHLNDYRTFLNGGGYLNANFSSEPYNYEAYDASDFASGGMENADGIDDTRALIREIVEERYVSGFGTYMPFNDARRLRKSDTDVAVPFPLNPGGSTHPERMPYSDEELNSNSNAPSEDPGIFTKTEVNS